MRSLLLLLLTVPALAATQVVTAPGFEATFTGGALTALRDAAGRGLVVPGDPVAATLRRVGDDSDVIPVAAGAALDGATGDVVVTQAGESPEAGVWGVEWAVASIPYDYALVIPGRSGIRLTADGPRGTQTFDYPQGWEAQFVIVEGPGHGFWIRADDADGRYKRLTVERGRQGWILRLATINNAPFAPLTQATSVPWRLTTYTGDWRVPAGQYRDWAEAQWGLTRLAEQQPGWVRDIRGCVILGLDLELLDALAQRLDPRQTLLYVPSWRAAGYDRDYPVYDEVLPGLEPFLARASELGFRVMLHVNYFGVDPLNPVYERFADAHVRSPWGDHDRLWWHWTRATPEIKFAYINPASAAWRELFVERMAELCERYGVDALHLDQTLCIYNDHNGLVDGMTMLQGNLALHQALRERLPSVALSGEGLNEVTFRHEAFAQRHAWGLHHSEGTWNRAWLATAHPVCSYLFSPYTTVYGYLGYTPPSNSQLYAAWGEAYEHWGIIPTLKPDGESMTGESGFSRQFWDEIALWQRERVDPAPDSAWPADIAFPFVTAAGERVARTVDHRLLHGDRQVSRTLTGAERFAIDGHVPGWLAYDAERLFGLDPSAWYPWYPEPRDLDAFHLADLPDGAMLENVAVGDSLATFRLRYDAAVVADLVAELERATTGTRPLEGEPTEGVGWMVDANGGRFEAPDGTALFAHPPWRGGTGAAFARYRVALPAARPSRFAAEVGIEPRAVGQEGADGVTFSVTATAGDEQASAERHSAAGEPVPLTLDLAAFAGRTVELELTVGPGPDNNPSFDWARWNRPRVELAGTVDGEVTVVGPQPWRAALVGTAVAEPAADGAAQRLRVPLPGTVVLVRELPDEPVPLPLDLAATPFDVSFVSHLGQALGAPQYASVRPGDGTVGGVTRTGLAAHPPNGGRTLAHWLLRLPAAPAQVHTWVGIQDEAGSKGVTFSVEANGVTLAQQSMQPGPWQELVADLAPWAGKPVLLTLSTDSERTYDYDWARWGEPRVVGR